MTKKDFLRLVTTLQNGNDEHWGKLYLNYKSSCIKFLRTKYNCTNDAEDIYMDAMLKFRNAVLQNKVAHTNIKAYILKITQNEFLKRAKKQKLNATILEIDSVEHFLAEKEGLHDETYNPLIKQETADDLQNDTKQKINALLWAKQQLDARCRDLLTATIVEGIKLNTLLN